MTPEPLPLDNPLIQMDNVGMYNLLYQKHTYNNAGQLLVRTIFYYLKETNKM